MNAQIKTMLQADKPNIMFLLSIIQCNTDLMPVGITLCVDPCNIRWNIKVNAPSDPEYLPYAYAYMYENSDIESLYKHLTDNKV